MPIAVPGTARWRPPVPDEKVAAALELSAGRAQTRGGLASAAAFLERAAALTADPAGRARRALAAAQAQHAAGAPEAALALLASAQAGPLAPLQRAEAEVLRAEIAFTTNHGSDAPPLLLAAARQLESLDITLARETYLDALTAAQFAGQLAPGLVQQVAEAARAAPPSPSPRAPDLLLDGLALMIIEGHRAAAPLLQKAVREFRDGDITATAGFAGCGSPRKQPRNCGTTTPGWSSPIASSGWCVMAARWLSCRSPSAR